MTVDATPAPPGATLGVFGGGQLGRMFCQAARRLGYRTHVYAPDAAGPAAQVADLVTAADYHDFAEVDRFARTVAGVTVEFENVPLAALEAAGRHAPARPSGEALFTLQDRLREKRFLAAIGAPLPAFAPVRTAEDLDRATQEIGAPAVLKTTRFGYDGKGQRVVASPAEAPDAWAYLGRHACVYEQFVTFRREVSVLVARSSTGEMDVCGPIENAHHQHILDVSVYPAATPPSVADEARRVAQRVAQELDLVGVLCVEMFETEDGRVLVNEVAPRPHNSGHLTIEGSPASQFEQQARALAGLPLGAMTPRGPVAMANLLGDLWSAGEPRWDRLAATPGVQLTLYGKAEARPGRKMGHLTAPAETAEAARELVLSARGALAP